jgi:hypothetical protein
MGDDPTSAAAGPDPDSEPVALDEPVVLQVRGLGARLFVTPTRVVLVRDRADLRPRSGIKSWPHAGLEVHLERPKRGAGRIVLSTGPSARFAASVFVATDHWPSAEAVAAHIRLEAARARRARSGDASPPPHRQQRH